jgi:uncharacterized protein YndB with AHSA1/START domain
MSEAQAAATVRVSRRFDAGPERVFDAWLTPSMIGRFMFGASLRDEEVLRIAVDPRAGGRFSFLVRRQGQEIDHVGHYLEIDRPRRLAFTWGIAGESHDQSRVDIEITPDGSGCELVLVHRMAPEWASYVDRVRAGWTTMCDALAGVLASQPGAR